MSRIAIIIVNFNTCEHLRRCLHSLSADAANCHNASEIIVVDNASSDGSAQMVRNTFPQVTLHALAENIGYGAAANEAILRCDTDYVLLLNSDTLLANDSAERMRRYLDDHPLAAIAGPRLHNSDGTLQASCYPHPTPFHLFLEESLLGRLVAHVPGLRHLYLRTWRHDEARVVPWVLGAALAIRCDAYLEVGGFDPEFFMYFEEIDLCHRLRQAGWQIHFTPVTTVVHAGGASTSQRYAEMQYRLFSSMQLFYRRHYKAWQLRLLRLTMMPLIAARLVRDAIRLRRTRNTADRKQSLATLQVRVQMLRECLFAA
jgi:GT2 family glycosyltransferase